MASDSPLIIQRDTVAKGTSTSALPLADLPSIPSPCVDQGHQLYNCRELPSVEDLGLTHLSKTRFRRRLGDRWACNIADHTHCYTKIDGAHLKLIEEDLETWATALHNGEATLLIPPPGLSFTNSMDPDRISLRSGTTVQYQRPIQFRGNLSLTDLRSMRNRLSRTNSSSSSSSTSSNSSSSSSDASSGLPGIGYLSGKAVKWVGVQILNAYSFVEIPRRRWIIGRISKKLEKLPSHERGSWMQKKQRKMDQVMQDILELSSGEYKKDYQEVALKQGRKMRIDLITGTLVPGSRIEENHNLNMVKLIPFYSEGADSPSFETFAKDCSEVLLQERWDSDNEEFLIAELATQVCYELAYGDASEWRRRLYTGLRYIYLRPSGKGVVRDLNRRGALIKDMIRRAFEVAIVDDMEHGCMLNFFTLYADDVKSSRKHVLARTGLPRLIAVVNTIGRAGWDILERELVQNDDLMYILCRISSKDWTAATLVQLNVCPIISSLLLRNQRENYDFHAARTECFSLIILRNLAVMGGESEQQAVFKINVGRVSQILANVSSKIKGVLGQALSQQALQNFEEITRLQHVAEESSRVA